MEPDVIRQYSSSPPPLDEGEEEEDEDEFGEFGGYCGGVSSSFSFSEFDTPTTFSQSHAAETSPPDLYGTSTQNVSSSGKNTAFEEAEKRTESLASNSKVSETNVSIGTNGELEASSVATGFPLSDLQGSNTGQDRLASAQDFEASGTGQHGDTLGTDGGGHSRSNGHSGLTTGTEQEVSTVTSTETTLPSRAESPTDTNPLSATGVSRREAPESGGTVTDEVLAELHDVSINTADGDQREERREEEIKEEVYPGLQGPSGEETFASFREARPHCESEDFGYCTETSVGPLAEVDEDFADHNDTIVGTGSPEMVPCLEPGGNFEVVDGISVEVIHEAEADEVLRDIKGNPPGHSVETDEDFGDFRDAVQGFTDFSRTESVTQEGFADFVTALSGCSTDDDFGDADTLKDLKEEEELPEEEPEEAEDRNTEGTWCSELPPSDSFADFSSAPFGGLAGDSGDNWGAFGLQGVCEGQQESWTAFGDGEQSSTATAPPCDSLQSDSVSHLFQSTFPSAVTPEVTGVKPLQALLEPREHREDSCPSVQGEAGAMWRHLLDIHSAHGLKVQWVGSRSNRILLDSLGIRNIMFTGQKKQPLIVPMFAAGLGMLEPTKDPVKPSPNSPTLLTPSFPGPGRSSLCTQQVASSFSCEDGTSQRRASFSVTQDRALCHSRQKSYS